MKGGAQVSRVIRVDDEVYQRIIRTQGKLMDMTGEKVRLSTAILFIVALGKW